MSTPPGWSDPEVYLTDGTCLLRLLRPRPLVPMGGVAEVEACSTLVAQVVRIEELLQMRRVHAAHDENRAA